MNPPTVSPPYAPAAFLYVKVPVHAEDDNLARDEALDQALREAGVGSVVGWGDSLGERQPDGSRPLMFHRIDIEVGDLATARAALWQMLPALGAPAGSEIHYQHQGRKALDLYTPSGWRLEQAPGD